MMARLKDRLSDLVIVCLGIVIFVVLLWCADLLSPRVVAQTTPPYVNFVYAQGTGAQGGPFVVTNGAVVQPSIVATGSGNAWASDNAVYGCSLNIQLNNVMATDGWTAGTNVTSGTSATPTTTAGNLLTPGVYYFASRLQCLNLKIIATGVSAQWYMDVFK